MTRHLNQLPAWRIAGFSALVMASGPLAHYSVSVLGPLIVTEMELSATQFGSLWLATFGTAGLLAVLCGKLTDGMGPRPVLIGAFVTAGSAVVIVATADSYRWLFVGLAVAGVSQAIAVPATNALVAATVAPKRQGVVLGFKQSGVQLGQFFVGMILPLVAIAIGWRRGIASLVVIPILGVLLTCLLVPRGKGRGETPTAPARSMTGIVWCLAAYACVLGVVVQATNVYLPLYANLERGFSYTEVGLVVAVLGGCGVIARLCCGSLLARVNDFRTPLFWSALFSGASLLVLSVTSDAASWLLWPVASCFSMSALSANVIIVVAVVQHVPGSSVGSASGYVSMALFAGFMVGPLAFGALVDQVGSFSPAWTALGVLSMALAAVSMVWKKTMVLVRQEQPGPAFDQAGDKA